MIGLFNVMYHVHQCVKMFGSIFIFPFILNEFYEGWILGEVLMQGV